MKSMNTVRRAPATDATALLVLMRELACFEGYLEKFCVTENDLLERGLGDVSARQFHAFLAEAGDKLLGYAVVYAVSFTFDLRPTLVLKELYVGQATREAGIGKALMATVVAFAKDLGCGRLKWDVLPANTSAQAFYRSIGGAQDKEWENWIRVIV
jgi:GNAT superfamily N-acetyltransferase